MLHQTICLRHFRKKIVLNLQFWTILKSQNYNFGLNQGLKIIQFRFHKLTNKMANYTKICQVFVKSDQPKQVGGNGNWYGPFWNIFWPKAVFKQGPLYHTNHSQSQQWQYESQPALKEIMMPLSLCSSACTYTYIIVWHWLLTYQKGLGNLKKEEN